MKIRRLYSVFFVFSAVCLSCSLIDLDPDEVCTLNPSEDYQVLASDEDITLEFRDKPNRYTVEQIITISSADRKQDCHFLWQDDDRLIVNPVKELIPGIRYEISVDGYFESRNGRSLEADIRRPFYYLSEDYTPLKLLSMAPDEGGTISDGESLVLEFNRAPDEAALIKDLSLSPETAYTCSLNEMTLTITPDEKWTNLTDYTLKLSSELHDAEAVPLDPEVERTFRVCTDTDPPEVTVCGAADNDRSAGFPYKSFEADLLRYTDAVRISFSEDMDRDSVENAFSLTPNLSGDLYWDSDNSLIFVPETGWVMNTEYTLRIAKDAENPAGLGLEEDYESVFLPDIEPLDLESLECLDNSLVLNSYSSSVPVDLPENGPSPYQLTFRFIFSRPFVTDREKQDVQNSISLYETFSSDGSPRQSQCTWGSSYALTIIYTGFNSAADREHYYLLEIKGSEEGIRNDEGSFIPETVKQLFRTKS